MTYFSGITKALISRPIIAYYFSDNSLVYLVLIPMNSDTFQPTEEPYNLNHNISTKEIDRDLINLHLPEQDLIASAEECAALYPPGEYEQMIKSLLEEDEQA